MVGECQPREIFATVVLRWRGRGSGTRTGASRMHTSRLTGPAAGRARRVRALYAWAPGMTPPTAPTAARKDVRLMQETAGARPLAALPGIAGRMDALIAEGCGGDDLGVLGRDAAGYAGA